MTKFVNCLLFLCFNVVFAETNTYRAAVVAYTPDLTASKPLDRLYTNEASYLSFIDQAGVQNSDIIVFSEDGLTGWYDVVRFPDLVELLSIQVPDPQLKILPCTSSNKKYSKVLIDLSCSVLKNKIYVVVNLMEQYYNSESKNYTYFNTDVVFDKRGRVVARSFKNNNNVEISISTTTKQNLLLTFGIYGRVFSIDGKPAGVN